MKPRSDRISGTRGRLAMAALILCLWVLALAPETPRLQQQELDAREHRFAS